MAAVDFWIQWRLTVSIAEMRAGLADAAIACGLDIAETIGITSGPDWASFALIRRGDGARIGIGRAQTMVGGSELILSPGPARSETDIADLSRAATALRVWLSDQGIFVND